MLKFFELLSKEQGPIGRTMGREQRFLMIAAEKLPSGFNFISTCRQILSEVKEEEGVVEGEAPEGIPRKTRKEIMDIMVDRLVNRFEFQTVFSFEKYEFGGFSD